MDPEIRLHYAPDNASLIVRLAMLELGIDHRTVLVDRSAKAQSSPTYRMLNPHGLIPALETPDGVIFETGAILLWLADNTGCGAPAIGTPERAQFLAWLFFVSNTLHTDLRTTFYPMQYVGDAPDMQTALQLTQRSRIRNHLAILEELAAATPVWLDGSHPSVLCYYIACLLRWMVLYPQDDDRSWFALSDTPHLAALLAALETREAVKAAQQAEGLGPTPFTAPTYCSPPEGSAT
ncbi:glutathione S-transferase family protein [Heliomarina baculiformis]|uniref:glutathione S-transferase family protein n=1 Tax=Heliomarina baculiformis TaxID=2872036 RepID=UPI001EE397EE|nr:glutathione S-transferase family protein [Heliomarina baculiformis]